MTSAIETPKYFYKDGFPITESKNSLCAVICIEALLPR